MFGWMAYCEGGWVKCEHTGSTPTLDITGFMNLQITWDGEGQLAIPGAKGALPTLHLENIRDGFEVFTPTPTCLRPRPCSLEAISEINAISQDKRDLTGL